MSARMVRTTAGALVVLVRGPLLAWLMLHLCGEPPPGLGLAGLPIEGVSDLPQVLRERAQLWAQSRVELQIGNIRTTVSRAQLGASRDVAQADGLVRAVGHSGNPVRDLRDAWLSWQGRLDIRWPPRIDNVLLEALVEREQARAERAPVAGVSDGHGWETSGTDGVTMDFEQALSAVRAALEQGDGSLALELRVLVDPAPISSRRRVRSCTQRHGRRSTPQPTMRARGPAGPRWRPVPSQLP
jgi:hypothetical protein